MAQKRTATAIWNGTGKDGKGKFSTISGAMVDAPYSFKSRFENEDGTKGTNPEELIAAAHASCFSMKLAFILQAEKINPDSIETEASVILEDGSINKIYLTTSVSASGIDKAKFQKLATEAKETCPISKSLNADIILKSELK